MHPPATAISRMLLATSGALFAVTGVGLQQGRHEQGLVSMLSVVFMVALFFAGVGLILRKNNTPLAKFFSTENDEEMAQRVSIELNEVQKYESVNAAWANLEAKVLQPSFTPKEEE